MCFNSLQTKLEIVNNECKSTSYTIKHSAYILLNNLYYAMGNINSFQLHDTFLNQILARKLK